MTKNITETVHSTTTIPASHPSPKQTVVTTVVLTTLVSTVTEDKPTSSGCVDKTITSTRTVTKHVTGPQGTFNFLAQGVSQANFLTEPSQSLVMLSQLSDGMNSQDPSDMFLKPHILTSNQAKSTVLP